MHLKIAADTLPEQLGLWAGMVPAPVIQVTFGLGYTRSIVAGARLGFFDALADGPLRVEQLAEATQCSERGTRALSAALVGTGLLRRRKGMLENTATSARWLVRGEDGALPDVVLFMGYCQELVRDLESQVQTGAVVRLHDRTHPPAFWQSYMGALAAFAKLVGREVVRRIRHSGRLERLLDIGGGHGLYAGALVQRHEGLRAEVLDLPGACEAGRAIIARAGLGDRVSHREGDFREADWGADLDMILIFNVLHNATEDEVQVLLHKAHAALRPGGTLVLCDAVHRGDDANLDMAAGWNELFFFAISGAQAWPESALVGWMEEAGFQVTKRSTLLTAPNFVMSAERR